ncbi:MAG: recombinase family protein [Candidatus Pacebacteria bacterium]|nr:recombinase family protein [Candidatus Paceibacterota bacterium]
MKVAIYCRTSKIDQNPENQKIELEKYAKAMGYDYKIFEEQESTRKTRPVKNDIFQDALRKKWDLILVWKLDRWARSMQELINDLELLRQSNVQFKTLKENIVLDDNPTNKLMINILSAFAQFERDIIRERTIAGLERARQQGKKLGRPKGVKKI